jgi:hypothetical protein
VIYRVRIRDRRPWCKSIVAESEFEAMRKALDKFRSERGYEPSRAEDITAAPDVEQFLL